MITTTAAKMRALLRVVSHARKDKTRPSLHAVQISRTGAKVRAVATCGHTLARLDVEAPAQSVEADSEQVLCVDGIPAMIKALGAVAPGQLVCLDGGSLGLLGSTPLAGDNFPPYAHLISSEVNARESCETKRVEPFGVDPAYLERAMALIRDVAGDSRKERMARAENKSDKEMERDASEATRLTLASDLAPMFVEAGIPGEWDLLILIMPRRV